DSVKGAYLNAGAVAQTAIGTCFGTAVLHQRCHFTVFYSCIFIALAGLLAVTCTFNKSCHPNAFACLLSHDLSDLGCCCSTAYGTCIYRSLSFGDGHRKAVTAWIAASAAVITGKSSPYQYFFFIYFYCKFLS